MSEPYTVCRNLSCIASNVNASGWCPVHASNVTLREVSSIHERRCINCDEQLDRFDHENYCSPECRHEDEGADAED